jgi:hypothetical protein
MLTRSSTKHIATKRMATRSSSSSSSSSSSYKVRVKAHREKKTRQVLKPDKSDDQTPLFIDNNEDDTESVLSLIPVRDTSKDPYDLEDDTDPVLIDFDEAHDAWMANKKRLKNGNYVYLCGKPNKVGNRKCRRGCADGIGLYSGCDRHFMWEEIENKGGGSPYDPL